MSAPLGSNLSTGTPVTGNPHAPSTIANQFAAYDAATKGNLPPPPPNPVTNAPPVVDASNAPITTTPGVAPGAKQLGSDPGASPAAASVGSGDENGGNGGFETLDQIAAAFNGEDGKPLAVGDLGYLTLEVNGSDVPLSDVIAGYSAMPDAQKVMAQRGFLESEFTNRATQMESDVAASIDALSGVTASLKAHVSRQEDPLALAELARANPDEYLKRVQEIEAGRVLLRNSEETIAAQTRKDTEAKQAQTRRNQEASQRRIAIDFPEWNDPKIGPGIRQEVEAYAVSIGFSPQELAQIDDPRQLLVLRDAAVGGKVKAKGKQVIRDAKERKLNAPRDGQSARGELPGKNERDNSRRAASFKNLQSKQTVEAAGAVFAELVNQ